MISGEVPMVQTDSGLAMEESHSPLNSISYHWPSDGVGLGVNGADAQQRNYLSDSLPEKTVLHHL